MRVVVVTSAEVQGIDEVGLVVHLVLIEVVAAVQPILGTEIEEPEGAHIVVGVVLETAMRGESHVVEMLVQSLKAI